MKPAFGGIGGLVFIDPREVAMFPYLAALVGMIISGLGALVLFRTVDHLGTQ